MTKDKFVQLYTTLQEETQRLEELGDVIAKLSPYTSVPGIGSRLIEGYISLLEMSTDDQEDIIRDGLCFKRTGESVWAVLALIKG